MKVYKVPYVSTVKPCRPLAKVTDYRKDELFNVRINGADVATLVSRAEADALMVSRARPSFCQVYLSAKPLEGRKAAWHKQPLPRPATLHTSELSRAKAWANVRADREISVSFETATHSEAVFATGAL